VRVGDFSLNGLVGFDLHGKTVGVVGTGKIGACLVDILVGFGCRILCYDMYPSAAVAAKPNTCYCDLTTLLKESDVISLHAPLTPETTHLINDTTLAQTKRGMILINTSRGALVDTKALVRVLKNGHLGGCALDVYEGEREYFYRNLQGQVISDDLLARLLTFQNVLITSHQARLCAQLYSSLSFARLADGRVEGVRRGS
jgi:D-lactate dehydrogenase